MRIPTTSSSRLTGSTIRKSLHRGCSCPPLPDIARVEGITKLTVKVSKAKPGATLTEGIEVVLNSADNAIIIPKDGYYLIVAESKAGSAIVAPATADDKTPDPDQGRTRSVEV